jgi:small subunit ribosomal protein S8
MSVNDTLSDMLTRIRNAQRARLAVVKLPTAKLLTHVLDVLKQEGFIRDYSIAQSEGTRREIQIELKYADGEPVIKELSRVSRPGRRAYTSIKDLPKVHNGLGVAILSTSKGVMSDFEARKANVGGEVLCTVL